MESLVVNLASLLIAVTAVCVAIWQVRASAKNAQLSNDLPIISEIMSEWRSSDFRSDVSYVLQHPPRTTGKEGLRSLPARWRERAYRVGYFLDYIGVLTSLDIISDELVISIMGTQIILLWQAMEPYIEREREYRRETYPQGVSTGFLIYFEHMVAQVIDLGGQHAAILIRHRRRLRRLAKPMTVSAAEVRRVAREIAPPTADQNKTLRRQRSRIPVIGRLFS